MEYKDSGEICHGHQSETVVIVRYNYVTMTDCTHVSLTYLPIMVKVGLTYMLP